MQVHQARFKAQYSCSISSISPSGISKSIATSIGFLPLLNRYIACVAFDFLLRSISSSSSLPSIRQ